MGCDIHVVTQRRTYDADKNPTGWENVDVSPPIFDCRSYALFGFLAGVRNYSGVEPISEPRGLPDDFNEGKGSYVDRGDNREDWVGDHSYSWLSTQELLDFDYERETEDRRVGRQIAPNVFSGGETCEPGEGKKQTYREFLDTWYFNELDRMALAGIDRIVFGFDS